MLLPRSAEGDGVIWATCAQQAAIQCLTPAESAHSAHTDHASPQTAPSLTTMNWKGFKGFEN